MVGNGVLGSIRTVRLRTCVPNITVFHVEISERKVLAQKTKRILETDDEKNQVGQLSRGNAERHKNKSNFCAVCGVQQPNQIKTVGDRRSQETAVREVTRDLRMYCYQETSSCRCMHCLSRLLKEWERMPSHLRLGEQTGQSFMRAQETAFFTSYHQQAGDR